jgi:2-polyprenyl-3-methyl-5-hydroxy-6-metoxy-1,4-benzoquinol methylase
MTQWNTVAEKYNDIVGENGDIYHKTYINPVILKLLGSIKGKKILDLACGQGYFSRILAKRGATVIGIDNSNKLLEIARVEENKKSIGLEYFCRDSARLQGIKNASLDIIVSNMSFHDIKNIKSTIKECSRVLKPKGRLIFSIPHPWRDSSSRTKDKQGHYLRVNRYKSIFSMEHFLENGVKAYHRPIDFYLQEFSKNNFVVSNFLEISVNHSFRKKIDDPAMIAHKQEIPSFLIVEVIKLK